MQPLKVAYILLYFPKLTETFIAGEITSMQSHKYVDVRIISLLSPKKGPVQVASQRLLQDTSYAPALLSGTTWHAHFYFVRKSFHLYQTLLTTLLRQPYRNQPLRALLQRLVVFVKAVSVAYSLRDSDIHIFHTHFAWLPGAATWICARLLNRPFTVTVHAYDLYSNKNDLLPLVSREASHVIAVSEFNRSHIAQLDTRASSGISVIHCGVGQATFAEHSKHRIDRAPLTAVRLLSVGSLVPKKGHHDLISACHLLRARGIDFSCTIIGAGPDERILRQSIQAYDLARQVRLIGARSASYIMAAYQEHDVFVLASVVAPDGDRDGIPVVLMEAGRAGLPVISTALSGIPELIRHGDTGLLVAPEDPIALAAAIEVLAGDPGMRQRMGTNARLLVEDQFDIDRARHRNC